MKDLLHLFVMLLFLASTTVVADVFSDADLFFDWAEQNQSHLFSPANQPSQISGNSYYSRSYTGTGNAIYLSISAESVWVNTSKGDSLYLGQLNELLENAGLSDVEFTFILNDTGYIYCADADYSNLLCPVANYPNQDAENGRDVTHFDNSDGHAGFSYTMLDNQGNALLDSVGDWTCVQDNVTGLVWEVKTDDGGLRDKDWGYSWYNSTGRNDGDHAGTSNGGQCFDSSNCDTEKYVAEVNALGLCGASDWRMPHIKELEQLIAFDRVKPSIDGDYFPNTQSDYYWAGTADSAVTTYAWTAYFRYGYLYFGNKLENSYHVRLVRSAK